MKNLDLCKWFPLGIYAGTSEVSVNYFPVRSDRSVVLKSNVVKLEVRARTPEQEKEYQDFLEMRRADSDEAFVKYRVFLKRYPKSMFEPRVRLHYAGKLYIEKEVDQVEEVLGDAFERSSPTQPERTSARYLHARTLKENGRFKEALSVLQDVDEPWAEVERLHLQYMAEHGPPTVNGVPQYMVEHIPPPAKVEPQKEGSEQKGTGGWLLWAGFALGLTLVLVVVFVWRVRRPAAQNPA